MLGWEKCIPHSDRAGRWLGWLTVWSDLSTLDVCLCPGCEFGVCEFGVWLLAAAEAAVRRLGKTESSRIRTPDDEAAPPATLKHIRHSRRREGHRKCAFRRPFYPSVRRAAAHCHQQYGPYDSARGGRQGSRAEWMPMPHPPLPESTLGTPDDAKDTECVHSIAHSIRLHGALMRTVD